jgi:hypothetical protein
VHDADASNAALVRVMQMMRDLIMGGSIRKSSRSTVARMEEASMKKSIYFDFETDLRRNSTSDYSVGHLRG